MRLDALKQQDIVDLLNRWAKWIYRDGMDLGYGENVIARMIRGVLSDRCPRCHGEGVEPGGGRRPVPCMQCDGLGRINLKPKGSKAKGHECADCKGTGEQEDETLPKNDPHRRWTCIKCRGRGRTPRPYIKGEISPDAANPAAIFSTRKGFAEDQIMLQVDRAVINLPHLHQLVIWQEYLRIGRIEDKARRIGVGSRGYMALLNQAHKEVLDALEK